MFVAVGVWLVVVAVIGVCVAVQSRDKRRVKEWRAVNERER